MFPPRPAKCECGRPRLDGHFTCGQARCGSQEQAEARLRTKPTFRVNTGAARVFRRECVLCGSAAHRTSECPETLMG